MPSHIILVLNSGSSSIKFSIYETDNNQRTKLIEGALDGIGVAPGAATTTKFSVKSWIGGQSGTKVIDDDPTVADLSVGFSLVSGELQKLPFDRPIAIGHRMVCGGPTVTENQLITPTLIDEMEQYTAFAPLHTPAAIYIMREAAKLYPGVPNFVCLDSYFHRNLPKVTQTLPIPAEYKAMGLRRFGAHGLSYESIVEHLKPSVPSRLIVAHLGNGASVTAIRDGQSIDTSMGLTPTGGIISGSRTGDIDPGVVLFILRKLGDTAKDTATAADQLEKILNKKSGLLGLSEQDNDMRALRKAIAAGNANARLAVDEFVYVLAKFIAGYIAVLGGLDMLVFTGGIGENDQDTRSETCARLEAFDIHLDQQLNQQVKGEGTISSAASSATIRVIPPAEDLMIVNHVVRLLGTV